MLITIALLFKQAGQQKLTVLDLHDYNLDYDGFKTQYDDETKELVVTLKLRGTDL